MWNNPNLSLVLSISMHIQNLVKIYKFVLGREIMMDGQMDGMMYGGNDRRPYPV